MSSLCRLRIGSNVCSLSTDPGGTLSILKSTVKFRLRFKYVYIHI